MPKNYEPATSGETFCESAQKSINRHEDLSRVFGAGGCAGLSAHESLDGGCAVDRCAAPSVHEFLGRPPKAHGLSAKRRGPPSLIVVGTGIQWAGQTTLAAQRAIERADRVLFAVADPWSARYVRNLCGSAQSFEYPRDGRPRKQIYHAMVAQILAELRGGNQVCAVFYGSPAVLTYPAHEAVRRSRAEGFAAWMLPAVSSLECLFADLDIDPVERGCQVFEAGHFLDNGLLVDPRSHLILCQIALIGNRGTFDHADGPRRKSGLRRLGRRLSEIYAPEHEGILYEAAAHPLAHPRAERVRLAELGNAEVSEISTLYVPPLAQPRAAGVRHNRSYAAGVGASRRFS